MDITIKGTPKEIAALVSELQERQGADKPKTTGVKLAIIQRKPYSKHYSIVEVL